MYPLVFVFFYSSENKLTLKEKTLSNKVSTFSGSRLGRSDTALKEVARIKIRHYRNLYLNHPEPITFIPLAVDTTGRMYDEFIRLLFLHAHREASALANELPKESDQFRFLRVSCFANLKGTVGLIMVKSSVMWISNTFGPFFSCLCPSSALHSFPSSHTTFSPFSRTFSSTFCLSGTC